MALVAFVHQATLFLRQSVELFLRPSLTLLLRSLLAFLRWKLAPGNLKLEKLSH